YLDREIAEFGVEHIAQGVRGVGAENEGSESRSGAGQCGGRRRGGLSHAPLAGEQQNADVLRRSPHPAMASARAFRSTSAAFMIRPCARFFTKLGRGSLSFASST